MFGFSIRYIQILLLFVYTTLFATKVSQNVTVKRYLKECECEGTRRIAEFESKKIESNRIAIFQVRNQQWKFVRRRRPPSRQT